MQYYSVKLDEFGSVAFEGHDAFVGIYYFYDAYGNQITSIGDNRHYHYHYRNAIDPTEVWMRGHNEFISGQNPISLKALSERIYNQKQEFDFQQSLRSPEFFYEYTNGTKPYVPPPKFTYAYFPDRIVNLNDETIRTLIRGMALPEDMINTIIYTEVQPNEK